ncbi:TerC family protein [Limnoglobus roseus]|uniref:TerC family protein n=1 Tax=Limnoglobus roseus TaxID=2598579 RepID=A0A5C1AD55_9BACT|nr:TerC family protein [Limnoglobus roseus]QEL16575.1 TerC family protein [Limnoglobus roseus]
MPRFRSLAYLLGGLLLVGWMLADLARADGGAADAPHAAPQGATVTIEDTAGRPQKGTVPPTLAITTEFGHLDLALDKVKTIDFLTEDGRTRVIVELLSQHHLYGDVVARELALTKPDGTTESIKVADLRELKVVRPSMNLSLTGALIGLVTLAVMEIVLGVDNIIFLAIIVGRLPKEQQPRARKLGLFAALGTRILLLFSLSWLLGLTKPVFTLPITGVTPDARDISWRDMILLAGGAFLIVKSVMEMHHKLTESRAHASGEPAKPAAAPSFAKIIVQIAIIDIVFSLDSVITAVGMVDTLWVMITAMVLAMLVMLWFSGPLSNFVDKYPTVKVLALSFLILIGVLLVAEGMGQHIDKAYVYFAMAFGVGVELVNIMLRPKGLTNYIVGR